MGRKAKLKQLRKSEQEHPMLNVPESEAENDPTKFVKTIEKQGYSLKEVQRCPEIPENPTKPQI